MNDTDKGPTATRNQCIESYESQLAQLRASLVEARADAERAKIECAQLQTAKGIVADRLSDALTVQEQFEHKCVALATECESLRADKERLDWMAQSYDNAGLDDVRSEEEAQCFEKWYAKLKRAGKGNAYAVRFAIDMARQTKAELTSLRSQGDKL